MACNLACDHVAEPVSKVLGHQSEQRQNQIRNRSVSKRVVKSGDFSQQAEKGERFRQREHVLRVCQSVDDYALGSRRVSSFLTMA